MAKKNTTKKKSAKKKAKKNSQKKTTAVSPKVAIPAKVESAKILKPEAKTAQSLQSPQIEITQSSYTELSTFWDANKITSVVLGLVFVALFGVYSFYVIPDVIFYNTETQIEKREQEDRQAREQELRSEYENLIAREDQILNFEQNKDWSVNMKIRDFGDLLIDMNIDWAPETVENFVRLSYRDYYNGNKFHRIVKRDEFSVIQAGDQENGDGTGGQSAFYIGPIDSDDPFPVQEGNISDELWLVEPQFDSTGEENVLINQPQFRNPDLYTDFRPDDGTVVYRKGLILMAKTAQPDSATSQFFITLQDTRLPAEYTAFGTIKADSLTVLDKIYNEVDPTLETPPEPIEGEEQTLITDGIPSQPMFIDSIEILNNI